MGDLGTLAGRLKSIRNKKGISMEELAKLSETTRSVIQRAELGNTAIPRPIVSIAKALEVSPSWLAFGENTVSGLSGEAVEVAHSWDKLPEGVKKGLYAIIVASI